MAKKWRTADIIGKFLSGEKYSNGIKYVLKNRTIVEDRLQYIISKSRGKSVLHIGFLDHNLETIKQKSEKGIWLRGLLKQNCKDLVDIDPILIERLKREGYRKIYCVNILEDIIPKKIKNKIFDIIVVWEVLEHIGNPVFFLQNLRKFITKKIIITVPNAFRWQNFKEIFKNCEVINSDHRFWFTPYTLSKVIVDSGYPEPKILF